MKQQKKIPEPTQLLRKPGKAHSRELEGASRREEKVSENSGRDNP